MMLKELETFYRPRTIPVQKTKTKTIKYRFEWAEDLQTLEEIQKFRAIQFATQFDIHFPNGLDQDDYDFNCKHAVIRDEWSNEIVAYTRVKFLYGYEIQHSYSHQEFHIDQIFLDTDRIVEIGRTCVHSQYRSGRVLSILWSSIFNQFILKKNADYLIGCVSVKVLGNEEKASYTHHYLQALSTEQSCNIQAKNTFEFADTICCCPQNGKIPKLFDVYLKMNGHLSKQAYYDRDFNCLDYFVLMDVGQMNKKF